MGEVGAVFKKLIGSDLRDTAFTFFPDVSYGYIKDVSCREWNQFRSENMQG